MALLVKYQLKAGLKQSRISRILQLLIKRISLIIVMLPLKDEAILNGLESQR